MTNNEKITLFATSITWIEGESVRQLERVASFSGMKKVVGFPDLHPGKGTPIGASMLTEGEFYPYLVGSDVGCGISLFATELSSAKAKPEKWFKKMKGLEEPWSGDAKSWLKERSVDPVFLDALGTIGHGNHFAEIVKIASINDRAVFEKLGLHHDLLFLIVHSGSRGLGESLLRDHTDRFRDGSLKAGSAEAIVYMERHNKALSWAKANRELIAYRFLDQLNSGYEQVADCCHNSLEPMDSTALGCFLHRKGAAPSSCGPIIIPGSRGSFSYLVAPTENQEDNLWSVAHGAGRKWNRSECKGRLRDHFRADALTRTKLGSYVICDDKELLYEEAPQAYKDIDGVIEDMVTFGLIRVIAAFSPLLTYKVRER